MKQDYISDDNHKIINSGNRTHKTENITNYKTKYKTGNNGKFHKKFHKYRTALTVVAGITLVLLAGVLYVNSKLDKLQKDKDFKSNEVQINQVPVEVQEVMEGYTNIAIFGLDDEDGKGNKDKGTHSDSIIVASINNQTKQVKLVSVYRDTYLNQADAKDSSKYHKANNAYFRGGAKQAVDMLNKNLDLDIEDYVAIQYDAIVAVVDALGGVEINVEEDEIFHMNNYIIDVSDVTGKRTQEILEPGLQTLDGVQASAYVRVRYTAGSDFKRTQRQRLLISKIAEKAQSANLSTILSIVNKVFPMIKTSLDKDEIIGMAKDAGAYSIADTTGFPFEKNPDAYVGKMSCVLVDNLAQNDKQLHEYLFEGESYTPSAEVMKISEDLMEVYKKGIAQK